MKERLKESLRVIAALSFMAAIMITLTLGQLGLALLLRWLLAR